MDGCCAAIYQIGKDIEKINNKLNELNDRMQKIEVMLQRTTEIKQTIEVPEKVTEQKIAEEKKEDREVKKLITVYKGSKLAQILEFMQNRQDEPVCVHTISKNINLEIKTASTYLSKLTRAGRVYLLDEKKMCSQLQKKHNFWILTRQINTEQDFVDLQEEEKLKQEEEYKKKMEKITAELDIESYDPSYTYKYKDILTTIHDKCKETQYEYLYTDQIGKWTPKEMHDDGFKNMDKALDRLEQDHLVVHITYMGVIKWKLTHEGFKKITENVTEKDEDNSENVNE